MIRTKQYNNISLAPKLERNEVAIYVSSKNVFRDGEERTPTTILYAVTDTIHDPVNGPVEIAYVIKDAPEGKQPVIGNIEFNSEDRGVITLMGSVPSHKHLFDFMEVTNYNGSNPNRDTTKPIWFYRRDVGFDTAQKLALASKERDAINYALDAPIETLKAALAERKVNVKVMKDDAIRAKAAEEGKKKSLEVKRDYEMIPNFRNEVFECADAEIIKFSPVEKCLIDVNTNEKFPVEGVIQPMKMGQKIEKLIAACEKDQYLYEAVLKTINSLNK